MARAFRATRKGIVARLDGEEIELLQVLVAQLLVLLKPDAEPSSSEGTSWAVELGLEDLLGPPSDTIPQAPADPALARLLPDGSKEDPLAAADFRRLTETSLRRGKLAAAHTCLDVLQRWKDQRPQLLSRDEARALMTCLTDLRLVIADRLGIRTEQDADSLHDRTPTEGDDGRETWLAEVYEFLGWLQESLVGQLFKGIDRSGDGRRMPPPGMGQQPPQPGTEAS